MSNVTYGVKEMRPVWKRRPLQVAVTLTIVVLLALAAVALVVTGELAEAVGEGLGLGKGAVTVYSYIALLLGAEFNAELERAPGARAGGRPASGVRGPGRIIETPAGEVLWWHRSLPSS